MLITDLSSIHILDESTFAKQERNGKIISLKYSQKSPYLLNININYDKQNVVIEFTGKILQHDYPKLISSETIFQCFDNINALGFCEIEVDAMLNADVTNCDVTKDIKYEDIPGLTRYIKCHIVNYRKYVCQILNNNNLILKKNATSKNHKRRMTIYNKGKEMSNASNRDFVQINDLDGKFNGLCRFELNLTSKEQIRRALNIRDTKLSTLLSAKANPVYDFIKESVLQNEATDMSDNAEEFNYSDRKEYFTYLVLKDCKFDIEKVEARMRSLYKRGTKFSDVMKPYRDMLDKKDFPKDGNLLSELLDKLNSVSN